MEKEKGGCTCPQECDCQNPPPLNRNGERFTEGVYHVSESCPIHNLYPDQDPECPVHGRVAP